MYLSVLVLPLLSFLVLILAGKWIGERGASWISLILMGVVTGFSWGIGYEVGLSGTSTYLTLTSWVSSLQVNWSLLFDSLTVVMLILVTSVSTLVHGYSLGYMKGDPHLPRFLAYLSLFTFAMIVLVTANNFLQVVLGWEGVGVVSYLLINFWYTRLQANKAAMKAIIVNRIGDFGLSLAILLIYGIFKSLDFSTVFPLVAYLAGERWEFLGWEIDKISLIAFFLFLGAVGKSAQLGLHMWLPDAMEGPTPVSSLIHAATMVTAGIFLIVRSSVLFEASESILGLMMVVGAMTAFFAASTALLQNDLKKVIAYSTCSQLGYMVFACGLSSYSLSLFHLLTHGCFKALLFLGAGSILHGLKDEQDMRRMGGVMAFLPLTYSLMVIGSLSLLGFPFLTGFYSKEAILEVAKAQWTLPSTFGYWLATLSVFFTAYYSWRVISLALLTEPKYALKQVDLSSFSLLFPLIVLGIASIFLGYLAKDMLIGGGTSFWKGALVSGVHGDAEFAPLKLVPLLFSFAGMFVSLVSYHYGVFLLNECKLYGKVLYGFLNKKWYFDKVANDYVAASILDVGYRVTFKLVDRGVLELLGPYGLVRQLTQGWARLSQLQTGSLYQYGCVMILGLILGWCYEEWIPVVLALIIALFHAN